MGLIKSIFEMVDVSVFFPSTLKTSCNSKGTVVPVLFYLTEHHTASRTALGPTQPIKWVPGALFLGVKRPRREADHSPPSSVEVKECVELYLHCRNTPSWRGAQLSTGATLPFTFTTQWRLTGEWMYCSTHFYLGIRWRWVVSFTPRPLYPRERKRPSYPLDRRLVGPQSRSGHGGEEKNSQPLQGFEPPIMQPVAQRYTAELSRLLSSNSWWIICVSFTSSHVNSAIWSLLCIRPAVLTSHVLGFRRYFREAVGIITYHFRAHCSYHHNI
jgi:hypothetical protein